MVGLLGLQRARTGHLVEGVALLARATSMTEQWNELYNLVPLHVWLGEAHLASGDAARARRHGEASLEMARTQPQRGTEAWAWGLLGEIAAQTDPLGVHEAETAYQEASTRASDLGMRPLVAIATSASAGSTGKRAITRRLPRSDTLEAPRHPGPTRSPTPYACWAGLRDGTSSSSGDTQKGMLSALRSWPPNSSVSART